MKEESGPDPDRGAGRVHIDDEPVRTWEGGANPPRPPDAEAGQSLLSAVDDPPTAEEATILRIAVTDGAPATLERVTTRVGEDPAIEATSIGTEAGPARPEAFDALLSPGHNATVTAAGLWTTDGVAGVGFATYEWGDRDLPAGGTTTEREPATFETLQAEHSKVPYEELVAEMEAAGLDCFGDGADVDALVDAAAADEAGGDERAPVYGDGGTLADSPADDGMAGGPDERAPALEPPESWFEEVATEAADDADTGADGDDDPPFEIEFPDEDEAAAMADADTAAVEVDADGGGDVDGPPTGATGPSADRQPSGDEPGERAEGPSTAGAADAGLDALDGRDGPGAGDPFERLLDAVERAGLPVRFQDGRQQDTAGAEPDTGDRLPQLRRRMGTATADLAALGTDADGDDITAAVVALRARQALLARVTADLLERAASRDPDGD